MTYNPYDLPYIKEGRCLIDDNLLDLHYTPNHTIKSWEPTNEIPVYETITRCYIDIETLGLDPTTDRIIAIGIQVDGQPPHLISYSDERKLLLESILLLEKIHPQILIGHNHINFDLPFIIERCKKYRIDTPLRISSYEQTMTYASVNGQSIQFHSVYWYGVNIVDTYHLIGAENKRTANYSQFDLKNCAIQVGGRDTHRLELNYKEIQEHWHNGNVDIILEYLKYDLEDTKHLGDYLIPAIYYQSEVVPLSIQQISVASPAKIWEAILEQHYGKYNLPDPDIKLKYDGAYVSCNPGLYKNAFKIDVSSMYPSIQLTYCICGRKDRDKHYLSVLNYLRTKRLELKSLAKQTGQAIYKQRELALKILINGGYGFSGTGGYSYNCMDTAALVTAYGRRLIRLMLETAREAGAFIIEVDTDGIILKHDNPQYIFETVQAVLPSGIKIDLDWQEKDVFVPKMKNYMIFSSNGKVKCVGEYRKRNRSILQRTFPVDFIRIYLESPDAALSFYQTIKAQLKNKTYPIDKISLRQRIPRCAKELLRLGSVGDIITYYWTEQPLYDKYCRKIKGKRVATMDASGNYFSEYYIDELNKILVKLMKVIDPTFTLPKQETESKYQQLTLF